MADGPKCIRRHPPAEGGETGSGAPHLGARAGKRERSRLKVEAVALTMFARRGFDAVRVEEVCAEAAIAPATFYRYFGSKEGVIFDYEESFLAAASELGASVDPDQPIVEQLRDILRSCALFFEEQSAMLAMRDDIVLANAVLLQRAFAIQRKFEARLAEALASRRQETEPSLGTLLDAAVCLVVLRLGLRAWRRDEDSSLPGHTDETYKWLRARLA
jgi:AcrR family transcriptional regulator